MIRETAARHLFFTGSVWGHPAGHGSMPGCVAAGPQLSGGAVSWNSGSRRASRAAGDERTTGCSNRLSSACAMAAATDSSAFDLMHISIWATCDKNTRPAGGRPHVLAAEASQAKTMVRWSSRSRNGSRRVASGSFGRKSSRTQRKRMRRVAQPPRQVRSGEP